MGLGVLSERIDIGVQQCTNLSESQRKAIEVYTSCGYLDINKCLRGTMNPEVVGHINNLHKLFDQLPSTIFSQDTVLYRGMYFQTLPNMEINDMITNHGFVSTSSLESVAKVYLKLDNGNASKPFCCLMEIHFKPGQAYKILKLCQNSMHPDEEEYLLPSGSTFKVKRKVVDKSFFSSSTRYIVDYIPPAVDSITNSSTNSIAGGSASRRKQSYKVSPGIRILYPKSKNYTRC
jgi:hypothetical protein